MSTKKLCANETRTTGRLVNNFEWCFYEWTRRERWKSVKSRSCLSSENFCVFVQHHAWENFSFVITTNIPDSNQREMEADTQWTTRNSGMAEAADGDDNGVGERRVHGNREIELITNYTHDTHMMNELNVCDNDHSLIPYNYKSLPMSSPSRSPTHNLDCLFSTFFFLLHPNWIVINERNFYDGILISGCC